MNTIILRLWIGRRINTVFEWLNDIETLVLRPVEIAGHDVDLVTLEQWIRKCPPGYSRGELRTTYRNRTGQ